MTSATDMGMNRTGIGTSPLLCKEQVAGARAGTPSSTGDEGTLADIRNVYETTLEPLGTVPRPSTLKGAATTILELLKGQKIGVLLDKLGERLAFERTGVRLYETLSSKLRAEGTWEGGPSAEDLAEFHDDELRHFEMLRQTIVGLGGDPTVETPSADLAGVEALGLTAVLGDPRATLAQSLHAILIAELGDHDGWNLLIQLSENLGQEEMANQFRSALREEEKHVNQLRIWLSNHLLAEGTKDLRQVPA